MRCWSNLNRNALILHLGKIELQMNENYDMIGFHNFVGKDISHGSPWISNLSYMVPFESPISYLAPRSKPHGWFALRPRRWPMSWRKKQLRNEHLQCWDGFGTWPFSKCGHGELKMSQILTFGSRAMQGCCIDCLKTLMCIYIYR